MTDKPAIVPYVLYRDGHVARAFLERAFGLSTVFALNSADGALLHAEMAHGNGVVMIGTSGEAAPGGGGIYVVVDDVDAHHARAAAEGAAIVYPPEEAEFGTRRYCAKDVAGHEWTFGSYQPQTTPPEGM